MSIITNQKSKKKNRCKSFILKGTSNLKRVHLVDKLVIFKNSNSINSNTIKELII